MATDRSLTAEALARAVRTDVAYVTDLVRRQVLHADERGEFRPSDIQRVRAVIAMQSPGIDLDQLVEVFRRQLFTMQPMDLLYPDPAVVTDTTPADLAASLGMTETDLIRLMSSAGFPAPRSGEPMRADDVALARMVVDVGIKTGGGQATLRITRIFGDAARRSAESAVAIFDEKVASQVDPTTAFDETRNEINRLGAELMVESEQLLGTLYRRHLEHALLRLWAVTAEQFLDSIGVRPATPVLPGIAFVDLSGYTRLTERAGDATAARLSEKLGEMADAVTAAHDGRVVKLLGDGAMLHFDERLEAVRGALELVGLIGSSDLPPAHGGVHAGPVIERDGDYFGRTVNTAARIGAEAEAGTVLVSEELAQLATNDLAFVPIGPRELKGVGRVSLYQARERMRASAG